MFCKNCGKEIPDNSSFCSNCGTQFAPQPAQPQQYGVPPQNGYVQQVVYVQQQPQQPLSASPAEKEALFSTSGSLWMLIACIVATVNLIVFFVSNLLTGLISTILNLLIVIGMWIAYANGRKKNLSTTGISLIRVPYIILFVFSVFSFIGNIFICFIKFNILSLLINIVAFVFQCICYTSVMKSINIALRINKDRSAIGMKAGIFAGVVMIISAAFTFIKLIYDYLRVRVIIDGITAAAGADGAEIPEFALQLISTLLGGENVITIIAGAVAFIASISAAIVLLKFAKKLAAVNG